MREDFKDLIWDSGRRHSEGWGNKKGRNGEKSGWEDAPKREPTHKVAVSNWRGKYSYPSWAALSNFLKSRVGQGWNKVWSEICAQSDERSHNGWKIRQNILDQVEFTHVAENGKVYYPDSKRYFTNELVELRDGTFYVSEKGILLKYKKDKISPKYTLDDIERYISDKAEYRRYNGIWFEVKIIEYFRYKNKLGYWINPIVDKKHQKWYLNYCITARNGKIYNDRLDEKNREFFTRTLNKKEVKEVIKKIKECL